MVIRALVILSIICFCNGLVRAQKLAVSNGSDEIMDEQPQNYATKITQSFTNFGLMLLRAADIRSTNVVFSPLSIAASLSAAYLGAAGAAKNELRSVLLSNSSDSIFLGGAHEVFHLLDDRKQRSAPGVVDQQDKNSTMQFVNAIFLQKSFYVLADYHERIRNVTDFDLYGVDFANDTESARKLVNDWVNKLTGGLIGSLLQPGSIDQLTRLLMVSAIYFKGDWLNQFKQAKNIQMPFMLSGTQELISKSNVTMMRQSGSFFSHVEDSNLKVKVLGIPYLDERISFYIFLPHEESSLEQLLADLSPERFSLLIRQCAKKMVQVIMPKFEMKSTLNLKELLQKLGIRTIFNTYADFSPIDGTRNLFVSDAKHAAFIEVNEHGSEAAAATSLALSFRSASQVEPLNFQADRPFLFAVVEKTTTSVLFLGQFVTPE